MTNNLSRKQASIQAIRRILSYVWKYYKFAFIVVILSIIISGVISAVNTLFIQQLVDNYINPMLSDPSIIDSTMAKLDKVLIVMACLYVIGALFTYLYFRIIAIISQGTLKKIRDEMFAHMEKLPIRFFDTHTHGDIMSYYTNDADTLRMLLSMAIPQILMCFVTIICTLVSMFILNWILTLVVIFFSIFVLLITYLVVRKSSKYFRAQQFNLAKITGYVEEYTNGQKVIKVFNHEKKAEEGFDKINNELYLSATKANQFSNILMPMANNLGNLEYILVALVGGILAITRPDIMQIGVIIAFINFTKAFTNPIGQIAQMMSFVINALAGCNRIFVFIDEPVEKDNGYVTLVNATTNEKGEIIESAQRTGQWAWKHYHKATNTTTYVPLKGDIVFENVNFGYNENKQILFDINLYAKPGQKVAFVGATGAGKTTITNLINRFYDLKSGKIRYDGINIEKIKKEDLRKSLGMVLQDTNLFTGTIKDNIKYGKEDATDEEVIAAAKLANADSFIRMLPNGYDTMVYAGGNSLSQGQRQLISIARAAVCNPPVMILDEATSSIDTRTEGLVQKGMDALMKGRTVFVIAHRLSTVQNSDVIMVLDHGHIIERGTHEQLIAQKGVYYQLYTGAFELE